MNHEIKLFKKLSLFPCLLMFSIHFSYGFVVLHVFHRIVAAYLSVSAYVILFALMASIYASWMVTREFVKNQQRFFVGNELNKLAVGTALAILISVILLSFIVIALVYFLSFHGTITAEKLVYQSQLVQIYHNFKYLLKMWQILIVVVLMIYFVMIVLQRIIFKLMSKLIVINKEK